MLCIVIWIRKWRPWQWSVITWTSWLYLRPWISASTLSPWRGMSSTWLTTSFQKALNRRCTSSTKHHITTFSIHEPRTEFRTRAGLSWTLKSWLLMNEIYPGLRHSFDKIFIKSFHVQQYTEICDSISTNGHLKTVFLRGVTSSAFSFSSASSAAPGPPSPSSASSLCSGRFPSLPGAREAARASPSAWDTWTLPRAWTPAGRPNTSAASSCPSPLPAARARHPHPYLFLETQVPDSVFFSFEDKTKTNETNKQKNTVARHFVLLPIKRSSSRSISRASAACFNQELWCFCLLLWNSIFSICQAKFTRSCGRAPNY